MRLFFYNILLTLNWILLTGHLTFVNIISGFIVGYCLLLLLRPIFTSAGYFVKVHRAIAFIVFFFWKLVTANLHVVWLVLFKANHQLTPAIVAIPLAAKTEAEIALLANLISLTPGTLSLDVSTDRQVLYIHAIDVKDVEMLQRELINGLEARLLEVMR